MLVHPSSRQDVADFRRLRAVAPTQPVRPHEETGRTTDATQTQKDPSHSARRFLFQNGAYGLTTVYPIEVQRYQQQISK